MNGRVTLYARAPVRVCDCGGWTDTWFAGHGRIFNIAVTPGVDVQLRTRLRAAGEAQVHVFAANYDQHFAVQAGWPTQPLIEAAITRMLPGQRADEVIELDIHSEVPAGAGTGTSASLTVALIAILDHLRGGMLNPQAIAYEAQAVEVEMLGRQCGIQDQLCAAHGGICDIDMHAYPLATVHQILPADGLRTQLDRQLALVFLGKQHDSSAIHERVIRELEDAGPDDRRIEDLRQTALQARDALLRADLAGLGAAMTANTEAQARLNPALVSTEARAIMSIAAAHGALGCKVNGAGGDGGSLTLLGLADAVAQRAMLRAIEAKIPGARHIPIQLSADGVRVWAHVA